MEVHALGSGPEVPAVIIVGQQSTANDRARVEIAEETTTLVVQG